MTLPATAAPAEQQAAIERFPHIAEKIRLLWGSRELEIFLGRLILDSRGGARQGFPMEVAQEMMFLAETNRIVRAIDTAKSLDITLGEAYKTVVAGDEAAMAPVSWDDPAVTMDTISRKKPRAATSREAVPDAPGDDAAGKGPFGWLGRIVLKPWFLLLLIAILSVRAWLPVVEKTLSIFFY